MSLNDLEKKALDCFTGNKTELRKRVYCHDGTINYCSLPEGVRNCCMQGELLIIYRSPAQEHKYYSCNKSIHSRNFGGETV